MANQKVSYVLVIITQCKLKSSIAIWILVLLVVNIDNNINLTRNEKENFIYLPYANTGSKLNSNTSIIFHHF